MRTRPTAATRCLVLLVALALTLTLVPTAPAAASTSTANLERDFHALVNIERAKKGLGALKMRSDIVSVARSHSRTMASRWNLHHNPSFGQQITGWQRLSENVGYGPSVLSIHRALMNSEGHRRNIMDGQVTEIGVGVVVKDGRVWVTQNFRRPSGTVRTSPPSTVRYGDVASSDVHARSIERVSVRGIVDACGTGRYCPGSAVTRGEFAVMLVRALDLPTGSAGQSRFKDVSGQTATAAEALARAGLTAGCESDRFCPGRRLTREQQATFFANALELRTRATTFTDVSSVHAGSVGALQHAGIVNGCTRSTFCPTSRVTRAQTASMIANNLG